MTTVARIRQIGLIMLFMIWVPFLGVFAGLAGEMGETGRNFADWVDQYLPGLFNLRDGQLPILTMVSLVLTIAMMLGGLALLFGASLFAGLQNRRVLRSGKPAQAEVLSAHGVGTSINNQPVVQFTLEVRPEDGPPFRAETERLVPPGKWAAFEPGAIVQVVYDPDSLEVALRD